MALGRPERTIAFRSVLPSASDLHLHTYDTLSPKGDDVRPVLCAPQYPPFQVVRALAWLGPDEAEGAMRKLKSRIPASAMMELVTVAPQFPTWLARTVGKVAHG